MTTVYRLPEEPPVGTVVRPVGDEFGRRYERVEDEGSAWVPNRSGPIRGWAGLFVAYPEGLKIVEPDPHPTPWSVAGVVLLDMYVPNIVDVNGDSIYESRPANAAKRIVDAVNKAAQT